MREALRGDPLPNFEAHITYDGRDYGDVQTLAKALGWKFSRMIGDPVLGDEEYCYMTKHHENKNQLLAEMGIVVGKSQAVGLRVRRMKIEQDVFDARFDTSLYEKKMAEQVIEEHEGIK